MADARKDKRTLLSLKIRYKSATLEDFIERYSMDISRGGVFIKAKKPLAVGTLLKFEFMLQDQSTLIHGVGRVVWRREEHEADAHNPAGMGIKFIKMDPQSRSTVERIVEDRALPGAFDQGKEGISSAPAPAGGDATKVRHVSEFLASALQEGGDGEAAAREAEAGMQRARRASQRAMARGAFSAPAESSRGRHRSPSEAPARGAMSAFGGVSASGGAMRSAAPMVDELDAEDDFFCDETTKVQELSASEFPDAAATVVTSEAPFAAEKRQTPVVPATSSPLQEAVPDLFGPDSFGPTPGELIDASLLDPAVATVPPKASALPRGAFPDVSGEGFEVPPAPAPVAADPSPASSVAEPQRTRAWLAALLMLILLAAAGLLAWKLGLLNDVLGLTPVERPAFGAPIAPAALPTTPAQAAAGEADTQGDSEAEPLAANEDLEAAEEGERSAADGLVALDVVSVPSGAWVRINGKGVGRTPVRVEHPAGTKLSIYSKARGFLGSRQRVTVEPGQGEVKLVLSPLPYVVQVFSEPAGATARAAGAAETTTPGELVFRSMPGSREIVISKEGYASTTALVTRSSFVEEQARMVASVRVRLAAETPGAAIDTPEQQKAFEAASSDPEPETTAEPDPSTLSEPVDDAP